MPRTYSNVEYADMVFVYDFCDGNATEAMREYVHRFPNRRVPDRRVIMTFNRLRGTSSLSIQDPLGANTQVENRVRHYFDNNPETSVQRASAALQLPRQRIYRTLRNDNRHPYHIQKVPNLLPQDYFKRFNFSNRFLEQFNKDNHFFQHEFTVNVWLGIWNDSLVGPFFLPDRLNAARYTEFLETNFFDYLEDIYLQQRIVVST
ncbi:hypothetical protein ALC60_11497 [Trachymyrmex zeteki]|uniref:DUF4817 domain-containing protein n=1 Tax=Mycetomoellerius zeteki TaxID=64791 RepID=A0A151WNA5_9HYME|nr:hypothetical protein ALC60_11497 [Trachymyrmex zeteki]